MPGEICLRYVGHFVQHRYNQTEQRYEYYAYDKYLQKGNTYVLVFSRNQTQQLDAILNWDKINILFKSKPCINPRPGHGLSRNTVVVFEKKGN